MTFITLLLCLALERFLHRGNFLARFNWFEEYVSKINDMTKNKTWAQQYFIPLILVVLPIVIPVAVVYFLSAAFIQGLLAFLIGAVVLFYCLGPINIFDTKKIYPQQWSFGQGAEKTSNRNVSNIHEDGELSGNADKNSSAKGIHQPIFWQANESLFAVIFWMALLGPIAALVYRLVERSAHIHASYPALGKSAQQIRALLDWLPVRLFSILFALAGNFVQTSQFCLDYLLRDVSFNRELIEKSGRIALGLDETTEFTDENYGSALKLIDRDLILFLIIVFAVTLGVLL
jgi:AmpE protein